MDKKYQSEILMVCHQDAEEMYELGLIGDAKMREFDEGCLVHEAESVLGSYTVPEREGALAEA
jgi:DNA-binding transcriptional regulator YiaG